MDFNAGPFKELGIKCDPKWRFDATLQIINREKFFDFVDSDLDEKRCLFEGRNIVPGLSGRYDNGRRW